MVDRFGQHAGDIANELAEIARREREEQRAPSPADDAPLTEAEIEAHAHAGVGWCTEESFARLLAALRAARAEVQAAEKARIARLKVTEAHAEEIMSNFRAVVVERNAAEARERALRKALTDIGKKALHWQAVFAGNESLVHKWRDIQMRAQGAALASPPTQDEP